MNRVCTLEEREAAQKYFRKISGLINDCASLASAQELRARFDNHEDSGRDRRLLWRRYDSNLNALDQKIAQYKKHCLKMAEELDQFSHQSGISSTTIRADDLVKKLMSPRRRSEYRHLVKTYEQRDELPPLWKLENDYRRIPENAEKVEATT